uniref:LBH domain-containing protein n=1 Tax=Periophthalmus magnuspinnatus TaxID=409849 RepID=A0A3B4AUD1_9GOBI
QEVVLMNTERVNVNIFPEPSLEQEKERLPSIVVEPTEVSEVESGELRWPPENIDMDDDEEDLFLEQCIPPFTAKVKSPCATVGV